MEVFVSGKYCWCHLKVIDLDRREVINNEKQTVHSQNTFFLIYYCPDGMDVE